jgi:hypothetical protein
MDFEIDIEYTQEGQRKVETITHYTPDKLLEELHSRISYWNNFAPDTRLVFTLRKVPSEGETLGVAVGDSIDLGEMLS